MTAGGRRWCDDLGPAWAIVDCGGERHAIAWRRGKLVLEDHDLLAERSLLALGAGLGLRHRQGPPRRP